MSNESKFIPNFLQVPNAVIDELLPDLTGAELKCYLVVIRKTKRLEQRKRQYLNQSVYESNWTKQ